MVDKKNEIKKWISERLNLAKQQVHSLPYFPEFYNIIPPTYCTTALDSENRHKNHIFHEQIVGAPFDNNLISSVKGYVNASPMKFSKKHYIACQGTLSHTLVDFWNIVWEEDCRLILTLTNLIENYSGRPERKFEQFWPELGRYSEFGPYKIHLEEEKLLVKWVDGREEHIVLRRLKVTKKRLVKTVYQIHMVNWPDGSVVLPDSLTRLIEEVDKLKLETPMIVHCMGGIGRTGTFIAAHSLWHDIQYVLKNDALLNEISFDVVERIKKMRELRYGPIVADPKQFQLIVEALEVGLSKL